MIGEEWKKASLETIGRGVATELFQREFDKVLENIDDPNCKTDAVRTISLKFSIKPNDIGNEASVSVSATSKLEPVKDHSSSLTIVKNGPQRGAYTHNIHQQEMDLGANVTEMGGRNNA